MGSIAKKIDRDGKPRYYARYKIPDGRWKWEVAGSRKRDAEDLLRYREREIADGKYGRLKEISFKELAEIFIDDYAKIRLKPRTINDYAQICANHLIPYFGKDMASAITVGKIQGFIKSKLSDGLSPRTINKALTIMGKIYVQAIKWGYASENPVRYVDRPREEKREMDYLRPEEIKRLMDACDFNFMPYVACAVFTGMREGEELALTWGDIDFEAGQIHIRRSISGGYLSGPKSFRSIRTIVMSPMLAGILAEHKARTRGTPDRLVFPADDGDYMSAHVLLSRFWRVLEEAGLRKMTWHSLRHSYAALMISLGENIKFIQSQMGHSSIRTTLDTYGHLLPQASLGIGQRLDTLIFGDEIVPSLSVEPKLSIEASIEE